MSGSDLALVKPDQTPEGQEANQDTSTQTRESKDLSAWSLDIPDLKRTDMVFATAVRLADATEKDLTRFVTADLSKAYNQFAESLGHSLNGLSNLMVILTSELGPTEPPAELVKIKPEVEKFQATLSIMENYKLEDLTLRDWIAIKHEAIELKQTLGEFTRAQSNFVAA